MTRRLALLITVNVLIAVPSARGTDTVIHACVKNIGGRLRIVTAGQGCSPSETPLEWNIQGPQGPQGPPGPPAAVTTACSGDVASVTTCPTSETCVTNSYPCTPYTCNPDTDTCRTSCVSDADCGQGASCDTVSGKCASMGAGCADDFTIQDSNGQIESCIPYKCIGGGCQQQCQSSNDCYTAYTCVQHHCETN